MNKPLLLITLLLWGSGCFAGITASTEEKEKGHPITLATDGKPATRWAASDASFPQWVQFDLGKATPVSTLQMITYSDGKRTYQFSVEGSVDGKTWTPLAPTQNTKVNGYTKITFPAATVRYVRVNFLGCSVKGNASIYEICLSDKPISETFVIKRTPPLLSNAQPTVKQLSPAPAKRTEKSLDIIMDMVFSNPGEAKTVSRFNDQKELARWGFNAQAPALQPQCGITLDTFEKGIVPEGSHQRKWIVQHAKVVQTYLKQGKAAGMLMIPFTDILVVPEQVYAKYKTATKNFSIRSEITKTIIRAWIDELFTRYPELDGLTLRFGETYLHDTPYHRGHSPIRGAEDHKAMLKLLREEVCVKRKKYLLYRTWGWDGFHTNAGFYKKVTDAIEPHPKLMFIIKHTSGDFFWSFPFNPTLGVGKHRQIVEVQFQREYEGKGAYPNYIGKSVLDGAEKERNRGTFRCVRDLYKKNPKLLAGVFGWTRGGGWRGPYLQNEFWIFPNAYVMARWAIDPTRSEESLLLEYATDVLKLSAADAKTFREICLLSNQAVGRGQYSLKFGNSVSWNRDQYFNAGGAAVGQANTPERIEVLLKEKAEAVAMWTKMIQLAEGIKLADPVLKEQMVVGCKYGYYKHAVTKEGWAIQALGRLGDKTKTYDTKRIAAAAKRYFDLWKQWEALKATHPNCATLYDCNGCRYTGQKGMFSTKGRGMDATIRAYLKKLKIAAPAKTGGAKHIYLGG